MLSFDAWDENPNFAKDGENPSPCKQNPGTNSKKKSKIILNVTLTQFRIADNSYMYLCHFRTLDTLYLRDTSYRNQNWSFRIVKTKLFISYHLNMGEVQSDHQLSHFVPSSLSLHTFIQI